MSRSPDRMVFERRKIPSWSRENHGEVRHSPDVPPTEMEELSKMAFFVPGRLAQPELSSGEFVIAETVIHRGYIPTRGFEVTPQLEKPLLAPFCTGYGGGRVGGGGMSVEALRRARRKIRRHH